MLTLPLFDSLLFFPLDLCFAFFSSTLPVNLGYFSLTSTFRLFACKLNALSTSLKDISKKTHFLLRSMKLDHVHHLHLLITDTKILKCTLRHTTEVKMLQNTDNTNQLTCQVLSRQDHKHMVAETGNIKFNSFN